MSASMDTAIRRDPRVDAVYSIVKIAYWSFVAVAGFYYATNELDRVL